MAGLLWVQVVAEVKFSIVIPVYNVSPYLKACLDSIHAAADRIKSNVAVEMVCVDDGSTDGSATILDDWAASGAVDCQSLTIKIIHQHNAGVGAARNAALDVATGDWIGFVDADDTVSERWLEVAVELIEAAPAAEIVKLTPLVSVKDERSPAGVLRHEKFWLDRSDAVTCAQAAAVRNICVREGMLARKMGLHEYSRYGWSTPNFVRREFIGLTRFPVGIRLKEDVCFFVQLANRLTCWVEAEFPGYFYTRRVGSAVMRHRSDEDSLKFVKEMLRVERVEGGGKRGMRGCLNFIRAVSTAIGYEFVQWAEERDPNLPYDAKNCPIRAAWRLAWREGMIDLGDLPFFWRPAIRWWEWTGQLWLAKVTRRTREWIARFI